MEFSHNEQLEWIKKLKKNHKSITELRMLTSIEASIYDSKSHIVLSNNMVHITMNHARYKKYIELVVTPEQK
jgi:hypothetical protein